MLGAIILPGAEYGVASHHQLFVRILWEVALGMFLDDFLVFLDHFLQRLGVKIGVEMRLLLLLFRIKYFVKRGFRSLQYHVAEHLDKSPVGVGREARVVAAFGQRFHTLVVQSEIQDGIHHSGHGKLRARTNAYQQGILAGAEFLTLKRFQFCEGLFHLPVNRFRYMPLPHVFATSFRLDGKARRNGKSGVGHLGQTGALAAQIIFHLAVTIGLTAAEKINVLGRVVVLFRHFSFFGEGHRRHDLLVLCRSFWVAQRFQRCDQNSFIC